MSKHPAEPALDPIDKIKIRAAKIAKFFHLIFPCLASRFDRYSYRPDPKAYLAHRFRPVSHLLGGLHPALDLVLLMGGRVYDRRN